MSLCDLAMPYVRAITPCLPGEPITQLTREMVGARDGNSRRRVVTLASNQNPLGMSLKGRAAREEMPRLLERELLMPRRFPVFCALRDGRA